MEKIIKELDRIISELPLTDFYSEQDLGSLIEELNKDRRFSIFLNHCHMIGTRANCFNGPSQFPNQLLRVARQLGSEKVLEEIQNYFDTENITTEYGLLLYSVHIDLEFNFSNGVRLINTGSLNDSGLIKFLNKEAISTGGSNTALLVTDFVTPKEYYSSISYDKKKTDWTYANLKSELTQKLNDTRLMLSISRSASFGVSVVGRFDIVPNTLHFLSNGISYSPYSEPRTVFGPGIIGIQIQLTQKLLDQFDVLSTSDKEKVRIAITRLNDSKIDSNWANKCINLRICLENLFCGNSGVGIAQTVSERAPQYTNFSKTRARKVYGFLSTAVHTGTPPEHQTIRVMDIESGIQKTILQYLKNGKYPEWSEIKKTGRLKKLLDCCKETFNKS